MFNSFLSINASSICFNSFVSIKTLLLLNVFCFLYHGSYAQVPVLGTYAATSIQTGQNTTIIPSAAPTGTASAVAYTDTDFTGLLTVDPTTGIVTVTDAKQAGTYVVTVKAFGAGGQSTASFNLTVTDPNPGCADFEGNASISVGASPKDLAIGDFNGDGKQDFAAVNSFDNDVSIRIGDGTGGFTTLPDVAVAYFPSAIVAGDVNGDGKQDLITADLGDDKVTILLGNGSGGFTLSSSTYLGYLFNPVDLVIGDFNGDGKQDIATANRGQSNISILLGDGLGDISSTTHISVGNVPSSIAKGDFNGDGKQDLAVTNRFGNSVSIRLGDGLGGFSSASDITSIYSPYSVAVGDFDEDGIQDLIIGNSSSVFIRFGDGNGGFTGSNSLLVNSNALISDIAIGDFDGDGHQDFATSNQSDGEVSVRLGDGQGGFSGDTQTQVGDGPGAIALGDFNSDGRLDLVTTNSYNNNNDVSIRFGSAGPTVNANNYTATSVQTGQQLSISPVSPPANTTSGYALTSPNFQGVLTVDHTTGVIAVTDARPAGTYEVIVVLFNGSCPVNDTFTLTVTNPNSSCGTFGGTTDLDVTAPAFVTAVGDFNGDGMQDLATSSDYYTSSDVSIRLGDGTGGFTNASDVPVGFNITSLVIGDLNGDGNQDFAASYRFSQSGVIIRLGDGSGGFSSAANAYRGENYTDLALGDFNNDGIYDLFTCNEFDDNVLVLIGDGAGGFSPNMTSFGSVKTFNVGDRPENIAVGDFNGDGYQDMATTNTNSRTISILLNDGSGDVIFPPTTLPGSSTRGIVIADFDGDGNQDLLAANGLRLGNGSGGFGSLLPVGIGRIQGSAVGDFNGDGNLDFASTSGPIDVISLKLGDGAGGFSNVTQVPAVYRPESIAVGDFNGDGQQDLAIGNGTYSNDGKVSIRLGISCPTIGTYAAASVMTSANTTIPAVSPPALHTSMEAFTSTDFTGILTVDSLSGDVLVTNAKPAGVYTVTVQSSNGSASATTSFVLTVTDPNPSCGTFSGNQYVTFGFYSPPNAVTIVDFDGDGTQDYAIPDDGGRYGFAERVQIGYGRANGTFASAGSLFLPTTDLPETPLDIAVGDFNGDGKQDFAACHFGADFVSIKINTGPSRWEYNTPSVPAGSNNSFAPAIALGDFNEDGKQDLVVANSTDDKVFVRFGNGYGQFSGNTDISVNQDPKAIIVGDFNGDGHHDFATLHVSKISIRLGDGQGNFTNSSDINITYGAWDFAMGDFNNDNKQDFVVSYSGTSVKFFQGNGQASFTNSSTITVGNFPSAIAVGDFNGDGNEDFATANGSSDNVSIRFGDGAGGFTNGFDVPVDNDPDDIVIGDFNEDGTQDFVTISYRERRMSIRLGNPAPPTLARCQHVTVSLDNRRTVSLAVSDIGNDSDQGCGANSISISPNTFDCSHVATSNPVTLSVTDIYNQTSSCTALVTVEDNIAPQALCQPFTVQLDNHGSAAVNDYLDIDGGSIYGCSVNFVLTGNQFNCSHIGSNTVTLTISNTIGGASSQCTANVEVQDNIAPVISLTGNQTLSLCQYETFNDPGANYSDNCTGSGTVVGDVGSLNTSVAGTYVIPYNYTDGSGNAATQVTRTVIVDPKPRLLSQQGCGNCGEVRVSICQYDPNPDPESFIMSNATYDSGATFNWFEDDNGSEGNSLAGPPSINSNQRSTAYYWVSQQLGSCSGPSARVRIRVKRLFTPTFSLPTIGCSNGGQLNLAAWVSDPKNKATAYTFYAVDPAANPGASPIGTATATAGVVNYGQAVIVNLTNGPQTYWVQSTVPNGCGGIASSILNAPTQNAVLDPISNLIVASGDPVNITFTGQNMTYALWIDIASFNNPSIGIMGSLGMGSLSFTAQNTGTIPLTATIRVIPYNGNCAGTAQDFTITVNPGGPIRQGSNQLQLFASMIHAHEVQVDWKIVSQDELIRFEIEKKRNDGEFEAIGYQNWKGNGAYQYTDESDMSNVNHYRLKLVYADGRIAWSHPITVNMDFLADDRFSVFPNPSSGKFQLKVLFPLEAAYTWQLTDMRGKQIKSGALAQQEITIDATPCAAGVYYLTIMSEDGKRFVKKLILE